MRHHNANRKFGRETDQRRALVRSLVKNLISKGRITTTEARAKELRPIIEKLVTRALKNDVSTRRLISSRLGNAPTATKKLVEEIAPRYKERKGGYTRILKLGARSARGDASKMAVIEFI